MLGDAVQNIVASYQLVYPGESYEALKRGAEWTIQMGSETEKYEAYMALPAEEQSRQLEEVMFGPGDHSAKRKPSPPGAIRPGM